MRGKLLINSRHSAYLLVFWWFL